MRLVTFSVQNYRSIRDARRLPLADLTILVGPNNEGKSNILRALVVGMSILGTAGRVVRGRLGYRLRGSEEYNWIRDFPINLQSRDPDGRTVFDFEFELTPEELQAFKGEVKSNLNGLLPIRLEVGQAVADVSIRKQGRGGVVLSRKRDQIGKFVAERLDVRYIQSVRTAEAAVDVVESMVSRELRQVEDTPEFKAAMEQIEKIQQPVLDSMSRTIHDTLKSFLPDVRGVKVLIQDRPSALRRNCRVIVNDGTATDLELKGDGVQSLAALSLSRMVSQESARGRSLLLAIEEPEAHLHPNAIHQRRAVVADISRTQQVIITTHSPLLVNRLDLACNLIVTNSRVAAARNVSELRRILGVRVADNLQGAELVLVVEGESDRTAFRALLAANSTEVAHALGTGALAIEILSGVGNLAYRLGQLRDSLCQFHVFIDDDQPAISAMKRARTEGLLLPADCILATEPDRREAELEDMYEPGVYRATILARYRVDLDNARFNKNKGKWSERMRSSFRMSGQHWDDGVAAAVKAEVAALVAANPKTALNQHRRLPFDTLVAALVEKLTH
jgi:putative ATP-dependent endonuclease of OLD family